MVEYHFSISHKIIGVVLLLLVALFAPAVATAQDPDNCVWENWNCTPTPGPTATGTVVPTATSTLEGIGIVAPEFDVPTSIPALEFAPIPAPSAVSIDITPIPTPNYPTLPITSTPTIGLAAISSTINISYTTPLTLNMSLTGTTGISGSSAISGAMGSVDGWLDGVVSYTTWITGEITAMEGTGTITVINAPYWYAPDMPRPMADVGWTFEQLTDPTGDTPRFTISSWGSFMGYLVSLPFQFIKMLWQLVAYLGPFGLFLGWLLIMFAVVLFIHAVVFLIRFLIVAIDIVVRVIEIIGEWFPFT